MSTGLETWNQNLLDVGPLYPFVGTEYVLAFIGIASWIIWHVLQTRAEEKNIEEEEKFYSDKDELRKAMDISEGLRPDIHSDENQDK